MDIEKLIAEVRQDHEARLDRPDTVPMPLKPPRHRVAKISLLCQWVEEAREDREAP